MARSIAALSALSALMISVADAAMAAQPEPWGLWHQPAASAIMEYVEWFDWYTLLFVVPITALVMVLLLIVMVRFRRGANPVPSRVSHHSLIEIIWTVAPIFILIAIAIPSFDLLKRQMVPEEEPALTVKATGYQWYWGYEYQDESELSFDSIMLQEDDREGAGKTDRSQYPRLLAVDNELVVPVGQMVRVLVTGADVVHAFAVPALGYKIDAVPGRLNETWFKADREGIYYGQCSELCGRDHAFMPIAVRVVSQEQYESWKAAAADDLSAANRALMATLEDQRKNKVVARLEQAGETPSQERK